LQKKKLVLDTTICIDLFNGQLLEKVTNLPYELVLPDVIVEELIEPSGEYLIKIGYKRLQIDEETIDQIIDLRERYSKPSTNDLFALLVAKINSCEILTGDNDLRSVAKKEGVTVHGIFWILDNLVEGNILTPGEAADALERIKAEGSWLPQKEYKAHLKRWRGESLS
jgi:predicted nucleic acid-binding protein